MIKSVTEISKYHIGDTAYYISLEFKNNIDITYHPYRILSLNSKKTKFKPPRIYEENLTMLFTLLNSKIEIKEYTIDAIARSGTGDYIYIDDEHNKMPEYALFDTKQAAQFEKRKTIRLINNWTKNHN